MKGSTYRRCYCRGEDGRPLGRSCPKLKSKRHGTWAVRQELPARADGGRRSLSRAGYESAKKAQEALDQVRALVGLPDGDDAEGQVRIGDLLEEVSGNSGAPLPSVEETRRRLNLGLSLTSKLTVGEWLDRWLASKKKLKPNSRRGYTSIIRVHLKPLIGTVRLDRLSVPHLDDMFAAIDEQNEVVAAENEARRAQEARCRWDKPGRPPAPERARLDAERARLARMRPYRKLTGPATKQRIRACLRTALNAGIARQGETGLTFNAAAHVELSGGQRPKGLLWTEERIARWRETGEIPGPVMVWTPAQLGEFLDAAEGSRYYVAFLLSGYHAMRRGEAAGAGWADLNARTRVLMISTARTLDGWTPIESDPKTEDSAAPVLLDAGTVKELLAHLARQLAERDARRAAGLPWSGSGKILTSEDGTPVHPETLSDEFHRIIATTDLPPINYRDLRHVGAGLVKAAGGDIDDAKTKLRHSTIKLTSDTYMVMFQELEERLAEGVVAAVPRARKAAEEAAAAEA